MVWQNYPAIDYMKFVYFLVSVNIVSESEASGICVKITEIIDLADPNL